MASAARDDEASYRPGYGEPQGGIRPHADARTFARSDP
jgi:hypothetical protein